MDIVTYSQSLEGKLQKITGVDHQDLVSLGKTVADIREVITELRLFTVSYRFAGVEEEVRFFKEVKPVFLSQYYFHKKKLKVLLESDFFTDHQSKTEGYKKVLAKLGRFLQKNGAFYAYYLRGDAYMDRQYFTRGQKKSIGRDENFTTPGDAVVSKILAIPLIREFVHSRLSELSPGAQTDNELPLQWTGTKVNLIEMIYALHAAGVFNQGRTELKQIVQRFESMFGVDLGNYARTFAEIKMRKSGQSNFLDHLRERLLSVGTE